MRVEVVVGWTDEGQRMWLQCLTSLSKNIRLRSYIHLLFMQLESDNNGSIPQPPASSPF